MSQRLPIAYFKLVCLMSKENRFILIFDSKLVSQRFTEGWK